MQATTPLFPPIQPGAAPPRSARDLVAALYRQSGLVAVCFVVGVAVSVVLYLRQPRLYTSSAKIWVQTEQQGSPSFLSGIAAYRESPAADPSNRKIETEIALLLTRSNAQAVVDKYGIRQEQLARGGRTKAADATAGSDGDGPQVDPRAHTVDLFLEGISVEPLRSKTADTSSNVLEVKFECADPALAPKALQSFVDNYLQLGVIQNHRMGEATARTISTQLDDAKKDLREAEDGISDLLIRGDGLRTRPRTSASDTLTATTGAYGSGAPLASGGLKLDVEDTINGADNGNGATLIVATLKSQTIDIQRRIDEARVLYTDDSENVRSLRAQLGAVQDRLAHTVRASTELGSNLGRLERQRQLAQERYIELQRKLDQINLYLQLNPTESGSRVVIDSPDHPTAVDGKKKKIVALLGPAIGLVLGLLLAALRELGGDRMRSAREAEWALGVPVLGAVPSLSKPARDAYLDKPGALA